MAVVVVICYLRTISAPDREFVNISTSTYSEVRESM